MKYHFKDEVDFELLNDDSFEIEYLLQYCKILNMALFSYMYLCRMSMVRMGYSVVMAPIRKIVTFNHAD